MVAFSNPHSPFDPAGPYATMYDPETITLPENVKPFQKYGTEYTLAEIRKARAAYLGKISFVDALLGRIVSALKQRGTWNNTLLVFTADHGLAVGEHGNIAKGDFWEEIARVPMVMRVPGLTDEGLRTDALSQLIDLYPTLIDIVGGKVSPHVRGRSLLPVLRDPDAEVRDAVFCEIHRGESLDYMVRTDRYKWFLRRGEESLYDLKADRFEQNDLIHSRQHLDVAEGLRDHLRTFLMEEQLNFSAGYRPLVERVKEKMKNP
jgi:arylsulfatase A-like enzyme